MAATGTSRWAQEEAGWAAGWCGPLRLPYDITLQAGITAEQLSLAVQAAEGVSELVLIVAKNDVDY